MVWFKVDDRFHASDPVKLIPRENRPAAIGLWTLAGTWSVSYKTNGLIPDCVIDDILRGHHLFSPEHLVKAGLWKRSKSGYQFIGWRKSQDGDYRRNIRKSVRAAVMRRDGFMCVFCGSRKALSLDHIIRYRDDGSDTIENLRVLCMPCNLERG